MHFPYSRKKWRDQTDYTGKVGFKRVCISAAKPRWGASGGWRARGQWCQSAGDWFIFCSPDRFHFISLLRATCLLEYNRAKPWFPPVWFLEAVHTGRGIQTGGFIGKKVILPSLWTRSRSTWEMFWWPRGSVSPRGTAWAFADSVSSAERLHKILTRHNMNCLAGLLTRIWDVVPVRRIKLVLGLEDLLEQFGVTLVVERRVTTQPDKQGTSWVQVRSLLSSKAAF